MAAIGEEIGAAALPGGGLSACPACIAAPAAADLARRQARDARLVLSLPTAHCAACISTVEQVVEALDGVTIARRLGRPLLVVHAEDDKEVGADQARRYLGVADHIRHHWANGQGHRRIVSAPGVIDAVCDFLLRDTVVGETTRLRAASSYGYDALVDGAVDAHSVPSTTDRQERP